LQDTEVQCSKVQADCSADSEAAKASSKVFKVTGVIEPGDISEDRERDFGQQQPDNGAEQAAAPGAAGAAEER